MLHVTAKCAQTIDGKIAAANGQSKWITSQQSRKYARRLRNQFDAILVGSKTVLKDNPSLNAAQKTKKIKKVILDSSLKISPRAKIFQNTSPSDIIIATTHKASLKKVERLRQRGVNVWMSPLTLEGVSLRWVFKKLNQSKVKKVLIEGGANVIGAALKKNLINKFLIFIAPKIMGDAKALDSVVGFKVSHVEDCLKLKNLKLKKIAEDLLVEADVHRNR